MLTTYCLLFALVVNWFVACVVRGGMVVHKECECILCVCCERMMVGGEGVGLVITRVQGYCCERAERGHCVLKGWEDSWRVGCRRRREDK